jgi:glycosyltransferase involved in cell wall biosynthesis
LLNKEIEIRPGETLDSNNFQSHKKQRIFFKTLNKLVSESNYSIPNRTKNLRRIILYTHGLPGGGAERQWIFLLENLISEGYEVRLVVNNLYKENKFLLDILSPQSKQNIVDLSLINNVDVMNEILKVKDIGSIIGNFEDIDVHLARLVTYMKIFGPDLLISQLDGPNIVAGLATVIHKENKLIMSARALSPINYDYLYKDYYQNIYTTLLSESKNIKLVANSEKGAKSYSGWLSIDSKSVTVVKNDSNPMLKGKQSKSVLKSRIIRGFFRLSPEKEPLRFINIAEQILLIDQNFEFEIYGDGALKSETEKEIKKRYLESKIRIKKPVPLPYDLMSDSAAILHPASKEGSSNTISEARLLNKIIVCGDAGDNFEQLIDYKKLITIDFKQDFEIALEVTNLINNFNKKQIEFNNNDIYELDIKNYLSYISLYNSFDEDYDSSLSESKSLSGSQISSKYGFRQTSGVARSLKIFLVSIYLFLLYLFLLMFGKTPKARYYFELRLARKILKLLKVLKLGIIKLLNTKGYQYRIIKLLNTKGYQYNINLKDLFK